MTCEKHNRDLELELEFEFLCFVEHHYFIFPSMIRLSCISPSLSSLLSFSLWTEMLCPQAALCEWEGELSSSKDVCGVRWSEMHCIVLFCTHAHPIVQQLLSGMQILCMFVYWPQACDFVAWVLDCSWFYSMCIYTVYLEE